MAGISPAAMALTDRNNISFPCKMSLSLEIVLFTVPRKDDGVKAREVLRDIWHCEYNLNIVLREKDVSTLVKLTSHRRATLTHLSCCT